MNATNTLDRVVTHSMRYFTWHSKTKHFTAERSDFNAAKPWTVLKEGAYDVPYFYLRNPATGNSVLFVFLHTIESNGPDYQIEAWIFGPTPEECERNPRLHGLEVHFLND
jgi:hypothetical protein